MKASLILTAAFALCTSAAFAQTTPTTNAPTTTGTTTMPQSGTMNNGSTGTMNNGTMNSTTDRMGDMNGTDKNAMRNNKRMSKKGMKSKTNSDGTMKTKM